MSALRVCALVVLVAGLATAAKTGDGCPEPSTAKRLYGNASIACSTATTCQETYCTCVGGTANGGNNCTYSSSAPSCTAASQCIATMISCLNSASDLTSCTGLADLHMSLLSVESAGQYSGSNAYESCRYRSCVLLNASAGTNCTLDYATMCPSPVSFSFTMLLRAVFTSDFGPSQIRGPFAADLSAFLGVPVRVIRAYLAGMNRRQATAQVMIVESVADGVNLNNAAFSTAFTNAASAEVDTLLSGTLSAYREATGNSDAFEVLGVSAGVGSSAFSGRGAAAVVAGLPPRGGASGSGSGSNGGSSGSGTTPSGSGTTPSGSNGGSSTSSLAPSSSSGAATQSLLAAVVVAVLSAMLF